jgi:hypothetical protein
MSNIQDEDAALRAARLRQSSKWRTRLDPPELEPLSPSGRGRREISKRIALLERYVAARRPLSKTEDLELQLLRAVHASSVPPSATGVARKRKVQP